MSINTQEITDEKIKVSAPKWFWIIAILALAWFLMDVSAFLMRIFMLNEIIQNMPEAQQNIYLNMPSWVNVVFGLEVFGGFLGSVCLLIKKKWAFIGFSLSLIGTLSQTSYIYFFSDAVSVTGESAVIMPLVGITICVALILFTRSAALKDWLS